MKKRLLFAFVALCVAVSGFALEQGEFVYTPQGRFQITGANLNANNSFQDMTGWTAIGEGVTLADLFNINGNGCAEGINSVQSLSATAGQGMYFKFEPSDPSSSYVVSFKMKGAPLDNVKIRIPGDGYKKEDNLVKVAGNTAGSYTYPSTEGEVIANTAEELTEEWQTFNYAIVGDGTARTYFISFTTMATTIEIADLQIAPALQYADLRQRDAMLEKMKAYKNCYAWSEDLLTEFAMNEGIANLEAIGDESGQAELDEQLSTANEILGEFIKANMDDYLAGNNYNYLGLYDGTMPGFIDKNVQKVSEYGDWTATTTGRAFWNLNAYPDLGHYAGNSAWNWNDVDSPMGVYMQKTLDPGSYVFGIESNAAVREDATSSSWTNNDGWDVAYGVAYIVKVNEGADPDTIVSVKKDLNAVLFTPFTIAAKITESGTYEIGFKAYCKDAYKSLKNGSVTYLKDASLWGKNENQYNQKQLGYEADVREQIATGRTELTKAAEYIANAEYLWGKSTLQACVDTVETKIAAYEQKTQDDIIATFDEDAYNKANSTKNAEEGLMVYEVYVEAVKDIIAANKKFVAVNDTLNSIQTAIDAAENTLALRIYNQATGKDALQAAIDKAKGVQTQMKATDYSEENAAAIKAANAELAEAVETYKTTVPASAISKIVDIDFESDAVQDAETQTYSISGAAGAMEFSHFSTTAPETGDSPYQQGHWDNGEQKWKGYLRVGNGTGTVNFDPTENGSMGTNILKVSCDFYIQGLNNRSIGFYLKDAEDNNVSGIVHNYYQGTVTYNPFVSGDDEKNALMGKVWAKSGGSYNDASPADADEPTATVIQKTNFEVILDYGRGSMYCVITSPNGTATSKEVALAGVPAKFVLDCNYDNTFATRRCWFDNLKIERVAAGETDPFVDGIREVNTVNAKTGAIYNLNGVQVSKASKPGLYIIDGKKVIIK